MKTLASIEKELWDLLLADKYFQKNSKKITNIDNDTFPIRYKACKKEYMEIKENTKEKYVLDYLVKKNKLDKQVFVFQAAKIYEIEQAGIYNFENEFIFLATPKIYESFTEYDLVPLIAHELGHITYKTPITPPTEYFSYLLSKETTTKEFDLFFLSHLLAHLNEYRADSFALENSENFEQVASMLLKLELINSKKLKLINIYKELNDGAKKLMNLKANDSLLKDHPPLSSRLASLFIESKKNRKIYSKSLLDLDLKVTHDSLLTLGKSLFS